MIRAAEAAGLMEEVKEWEQRAQVYRAARHRRRMDLIRTMIYAPKAIGYATATGAGILLMLGILLAWANSNTSDVLTPIETVIDLVRLIALVGGIIWDPVLFGAPWLALAAVWSVGRRRHTAPQWALPLQDRDMGGPITPSIVVAFRDLGISDLRKAIENMGGVGAAMLSGIKLGGCGVEVDVALPSGVSTEEIQNRRRKLAENLNWHEHEVFITIRPKPRTVRPWIADSGALDEPIGVSPLMLSEDVSADYYTGAAPWGQNLRGDAVDVSVFQRHILLTGLSNQGTGCPPRRGHGGRPGPYRERDSGTPRGDGGRHRGRGRRVDRREFSLSGFPDLPPRSGLRKGGSGRPGKRVSGNQETGGSASADPPPSLPRNHDSGAARRVGGHGLNCGTARGSLGETRGPSRLVRPGPTPLAYFTDHCPVCSANPEFIPNCTDTSFDVFGTSNTTQPRAFSPFGKFTSDDISGPAAISPNHESNRCPSLSAAFAPFAGLSAYTLLPVFTNSN